MNFLIFFSTERSFCLYNKENGENGFPLSGLTGNEDVFYAIQ